MRPTSLWTFFSQVNTAYKFKQSQITIRIKKNILDILLILQKEGLVAGYTYNREMRILSISLQYYHTIPAWQQVKIYSTPSHQIRVSKKQVNLLLKDKGKTTLFLFSTPVGIQSGQALQKQGIGGMLLARIN